jgi:hypothetical protein
MILNRIIKYILIGLIAFIATRYIPSVALNNDETIAIVICISIGYAIIDKLLPSYIFK